MRFGAVLCGISSDPCWLAISKGCYFKGPPFQNAATVRDRVRNSVRLRVSARVSLAFNTYGFIVV